MNLHAIAQPNPLGALFYFVKGGSGRPITNRCHLFVVQRGTPPPPGAIRPTWAGRYWRSSRQTWTPFSTFQNQYDPEFILNPLCGRLKTRSRFPSLQRYHYWRNEGKCPDCTAIAQAQNLTFGTLDEVLAEDPWTRIPQEEREEQSDPISGL